ncbi:DUF378 domain-containing protein [uncultured Rummeliibacillus sp.]|uniref:DUF378 domain-containing protein n=1 Tax=uncultured Rummeliibacillus sp. TaxID=762292 RepID=UPI00262CF61C|nr:DUF378 domain-containing protein [uncultured Rummeliibacillus sp.]
MNGLQRIALFLTIIGALNWGLIGIFQFDVVATLFRDGQASFAARAIYTIIAIGGLLSLGALFMPNRTHRVVKDNVRPLKSV